MARRASHPDQLSQEARSALADYLAELEKLYPGGTKKCQIVPWPEYGEGSYLVKVPSPSTEEKWIEISARMAEVGARILVDSDQLFVLTV